MFGRIGRGIHQDIEGAEDASRAEGGGVARGAAPQLAADSGTGRVPASAHPNDRQPPGADRAHGGAIIVGSRIASVGGRRDVVRL